MQKRKKKKETRIVTESQKYLGWKRPFVVMHS